MVVVKNFFFLLAVLLNWLRLAKTSIYYVVPGVNWSIDWDGKYISDNINRAYRNRIARVTVRYRYLRNQIIHFGSVQGFTSGGYLVHRSNKVLVTIFHDDFQSNPDQLAILQKNASRIDQVVIANSLMFNKVMSWGIDKTKIRTVPIGVDLNLFKKHKKSVIANRRKNFGIPHGSVCIGSFQKDGEGWEDGYTPKLIKGPDVFIDVVATLSKKYPVFVLLTGPARGYVKTNLEKLGIPYRHDILDDYHKLADYYNCLDLYMVTSREEGGPKSILESFACEVPVISTRVGMAVDIIDDGINGFLSPTEDKDNLVDQASMLIENEQIGENFTKNARETVEKFDWSVIAHSYLKEVYRKYL